MTYEGQEPYQKFTASGKIKDNRVYGFGMEGGFVPYRKDIEFLKNTK